MSHLTPEEDEAAYQTAQLQLQGQPPVQLEVDIETAYLLIGNLQLALRHPANQSKGSQVMERFAKELQERIAPVGSPAWNFLEMGWQPEFDSEQE